MFSTALATVPAAFTGVPACTRVANPVVAMSTTTEWYAPGIDAISGFDHKRTTRRPPSPT